MAVINKYPSSLGTVSQTENKWSIENSDKTISEIDLNSASSESLKNFRLGLAVGEVLYKLNNGILVQANPYEGDSKNNITQTPSNSQNQGKALSLNNGHSILGDNQYPTNMGGFTDRLLISLLAGFGLGVIAAATYICINLSKTTIYLQ